MRTGRQVFLFGGATLVALALTGCPDKRPGKTAVFANRPTSKPQASRSASNAPFAPFANKGKKVASEQGQSLPLPLEGHNSVAQLAVETKGLPAEDAALYAQAYRLSFCTDKSKRDQMQARRIYQQLVSKHPNFAPAYRGVGYTYVDAGMDFQNAVMWYEKGVEADANYGLTHYGLAFLLGAMRETERGFSHFQSAMKLGVKDERGLKGKFYQNMNEGIRTH